MLRVRRLPVRAPLVRRRALRPADRARRRRSLTRHGTVGHPDLLAERVQPGPGPVPAHALRRGHDGERVPVPVPVLDRRARRAPVLGSRSVCYERLRIATAIAIAACCRRSVAGAVAARRQAERRHHDRGPGRARARGRRRPDRRSSPSRAATRTRTSSKPKPSFILKLQQGRPAHRRRPRAGDRLAAAAHPAEPEREDPAGRRRLPGCLAHREDPRDPDRADHARDGRRASAGQPALLARPGQRPAHRAGDPGQAVETRARRRGLLRRSATRTSTSGWPRPRSAGTR